MHLKLYCLPAEEMEREVELVQAFQAVEAAAQRFFVTYQQVVAAVCAMMEASGKRALFVPACSTFWFDMYVIFLNENGVKLDYSESRFWPCMCILNVCLYMNQKLR